MYVVSVHMCTFVCRCRGQREGPSLIIPLTVFFETGTLSPKLVGSQESLCSVSLHSSFSVLELCMAIPGFLFQFGDLKSGPHACTEYTFTS